MSMMQKSIFASASCMYRSARLASFLLLAGLCWAGISAAQTQAPDQGYEYYEIGDTSATTPGKVTPALMLAGGGKEVDAAYRWFVAKAGRGHIVILSASQQDALQKYMYAQPGGVASVQTLVFHSRKAASDPRVLSILRKADGIFIRGGDQSNYVRFFKGTPLNKVLDRHVSDGKPIGGTSAGLAILGGYGYGAMDDGSMQSADAMKHPLGKGMTLVDDFLHMPYLKHVITDTHFAARNRLGRLIAFIGKLRHEEHEKIIGLGVDEGAILCVDSDGTGKVYTNNNGFAWLVRPQGAPEQINADKPLTYMGTRITGIGTQSLVNMHDMSVTRPVFTTVADVRDGRMSLHGNTKPLLVIHGGAGVQHEGMTPEIEKGARAALTRALRQGYAQLKAGKPSLDAVTATITVLEDSPYFNAGKGAVFTHDGTNELDASIMDGSTLAAGGVAAVKRVKNPILLARAVMEHSPHVLMVEDGAEKFAVAQGFKLVEPSYFRTEASWEYLQEALKQDAADKHAEWEGEGHFGTVGAIARDTWGRLAAATSTGGINDKLYGRVGDSPIPGAGTYANADCAVSGTGWGEYYIRVSAAREICLRMSLMHQSAQEAAQAVINDEIPRLGGDGGAIVLGADGSVAFPYNTEGMYRGWIGEDGVPHVAVFANDTLEMPPPAQ